MVFTYPQNVLFKHCDPAGIVFYPRYFEMINDCVEAFFNDALATPFHRLIAAGGVPTVRIENEFVAPSRHGDRLGLDLSVQRLGRSSLDLSIIGRCEKEVRFTCRSTLVRTGPDGRSSPWEPGLRTAMKAYLGEPT